MTKLSAAKYSGVAIVFLLTGMTMGHASQVQVIHDTQTVTKTVNVPQIQTKTITVTKTLPADTTDWKTLIEIDNHGFDIASQMMGVEGKTNTLAGQAIMDAYNHDVQAMTDDTATVKDYQNQINDLTDQLNTVAAQRKVIAKKLGY